MAWIELHQSLTTHKKTRRLARCLGLGVPQGIPQTIGHLCLFWLWCVDGTKDGSLADLDAQDIADAAGWTEDPDIFLDAMVTSGFIDKTQDCMEIHDWNDYIGRLLEQRKETREKDRLRKQKYRERKRQEASETQPEESDTIVDDDWKKVAICYEQNIGMLPTGASAEMLLSYFDDMGADVLCEAIRITNVASPSNPWKYLKAVLDKWIENGVTDLDSAKAYTKDLERKLADCKKQKSSKKELGTADDPPAIRGDFY